MKGFLIRTISGFLIVILTVYAILKGGAFMSFFIFLLSIIGIREFYNALTNIKIKPIKPIGYLSCIGFLLNSLGYKWATTMFISFITLTVLLLLLVIKKDTNLTDIATTFFGIFYIPFLMQHIIYLDDTIYIWLIFIIAWGTDTFAYLSGSLFGKNKLCPKLSPKKTIEGSVGGILGALLLIMIFSIYFKLSPLWAFALLALIGAIIAQIGDLIASKIKRMTGIKDYGFIMPGHGGILDRFDSIILTGPFVYYFVFYFL